MPPPLVRPAWMPGSRHRSRPDVPHKRHGRIRSPHPLPAPPNPPPAASQGGRSARPGCSQAAPHLPRPAPRQDAAPGQHSWTGTARTRWGLEAPAPTAKLAAPRMRRSISSLSHRAFCGPRCRDGAGILPDLTMRTENPSRGGTVDWGEAWEAASLPRNAQERSSMCSGSAETDRGGRHGRLTTPPQPDDNGRSLGAGFSLVLGPVGPHRGNPAAIVATDTNHHAIRRHPPGPGRATPPPSRR